MPKPLPYKGPRTTARILFACDDTMLSTALPSYREVARHLEREMPKRAPFTSVERIKPEHVAVCPIPFNNGLWIYSNIADDVVYDFRQTRHDTTRRRSALAFVVDAPIWRGATLDRIISGHLVQSIHAKQYPLGFPLMSIWVLHGDSTLKRVDDHM